MQERNPFIQPLCHCQTNSNCCYLSVIFSLRLFIASTFYAHSLLSNINFMHHFSGLDWSGNTGAGVQQSDDIIVVFIVVSSR